MEFQNSGRTNFDLTSCTAVTFLCSADESNLDSSEQNNKQSGGFELSHRLKIRQIGDLLATLLTK